VSGLSVTELARHGGTTVRNVRAYQDRGLLLPPERRGRHAIYNDTHLARLKVIQALLERGYSLANIEEMIAAWEGGQDLGSVLGLAAAVTSPFSNEPPGTLTPDELASVFGTDPVALGKAIELGIIEWVDGRFRVPSPRTLRAGVELVAAGVPVAAVLEHARLLRADIERISERLVGLVVEHVFGGRDSAELPAGADVARLADVVRRLRPMAEMVVDAELARALETSTRAALGERLEHVLQARGGKRGKKAR
jgi:DNA-binding transcriptional MerR regulator